MLPALSLALLTQTPTPFDGLNIQLFERPAAPVTQGPTTAWQGKVVRFHPERLVKQTVGQYIVRVTDLSKVNPKPSAEQFFQLHERAQRQNPQWGARIFRTSTGQIGAEKFLMLNGTVLAGGPNGVNIGYIVTAAFVVGDKAYEYLALTPNSEVAATEIGVIKGMTYGTIDLKSVSGLPETTSGDYSLAGSPISVRAAGPIHPVLRTAPDPTFVGLYEGSAPSDKKQNHTYLLASIKPDDKRTDDELLAYLAEIVFGKGSLPSSVKAKDGSATAEFDFKEGTYDRKGWLRFERKGQIVALLGAKTGPIPNFGGIELVRK